MQDGKNGKIMISPETLLPRVPNDLGAAIGQLEDELFADLEVLDNNQPDPLSPIGERIAHTVATARVRATAEVIADLHRSRGDS